MTLKSQESLQNQETQELKSHKIGIDDIKKDIRLLIDKTLDRLDSTSLKMHDLGFVAGLGYCLRALESLEHEMFYIDIGDVDIDLDVLESIISKIDHGDC